MSTPLLVNNIPLLDLIKDILPEVQECIGITASVAKAIQAADPTERYVHIEATAIDSYSGGRNHLWRIADWRNDYARQQKKKELASLERQVHVLHSELRQSLARKLSAQTGAAQEMLTDAANTLLKSRNPRVMETFGLDIVELLAAEQAVNEFKSKK